MSKKCEQVDQTFGHVINNCEKIIDTESKPYIDSRCQVYLDV